MSETEQHIGKLEPVKSDFKDIQDIAKEILEKEGWDHYEETYLESLISEGYRKYVVYDGNIYKVFNKSSDMDSDIFYAFKNPDGTIGYILQYYNGGCSFNEAMKEALGRI